MSERSEIEILGTGLEFVNKGLRATKPVVDKLIENADDMIHMLVYRFGDPALITPIEDRVNMGVKLCVVVDRLFGEDEKGKSFHPKVVVDKLIELNKEKHVTLANFKKQDKGFLHAKVIVADRREMVVGSANFSKRGMQHSYELGFRITGIECQTVANIIEDLSINTELVEVVR